MNNKFYQHELPQPFHVSVGAVVFNENFEVCLHHFCKKDIDESVHFLMDYLDDIWHTVRESLEGNEPLHDAVVRGVQEEFGMTGVVDKYLGAKIDTITEPGKNSFEKLTLYHAVRLVSIDERPMIDEENKSVMEWYTPQSTLDIFKHQAEKTRRPELDEVVIIERFITAYNL